jgi:SAM-dependent methyltransferase
MSYCLPFKVTDKVCELGGAENAAFHPNIDMRACQGVDMVADLNEGIPLADESYDGVFSEFLMEHLRPAKLRGFIAEIHRILRPGGSAVIITSNLYEQAKVIVEKEEKGEVNDDIIHMIFGGKPDFEGNYHHSSLTPNFAVRLFKEAGFHEVTIYEHPVAKQIWGKSTDMLLVARKSGAHIEKK